MSFVQFRIHPSVGIARYGNSELAYYVGSDFPRFLQELFPKTRTLPRARTHPEKVLNFGNGNDTKTVAAAGFTIFNPADSAGGDDSNYKDTAGHIKPQAARFRVYAYVYSSKDGRETRDVFEVTADMAEITWGVELANLKSRIGNQDTDQTPARAELQATPSKEANVEITQIKDADRPTLGYMMLERKPGQAGKFTGRMHLIGNNGFCTTPSSTMTGDLWSDEWFDSGCDGPVDAKIKIKDFNAFKAKVTKGNADTLKYFDPSAEDPIDAAAGTEVNAVPAWVAVGPPDYVADMGHFVSLWDIALDGAMEAARNCKVKKQPKLHRQVHNTTEAERYRHVDYLVHIHPQLCLFSDVKFVSGVAKGGGAQTPGHDNDQSVTDTKIEVGLPLNVRNDAQRADMDDPKKKKDLASPNLPDKAKPAIHKRLRKPATLYEYFADKYQRFFIEDNKNNPVKNGHRRGQKGFPRRLGRRVGYVSAATRSQTAGDRADVEFDFPSYIGNPPQNLRAFHSIDPAKHPNRTLTHNAGKACGKNPDLKTKGGAASVSGNDLTRIDDMFWPVTATDMPLLRELAYTHYQHWQFDKWQAPVPGDGDMVSRIFELVIPRALNAQLETGSNDRDLNFERLQTASPKFAPAMIDMAYAGSALGGSFLPGIEVGREAGVAANWTMLHGATDYFPDIRFHRIDGSPAEQFAGRLTKDLAVPWQVDFRLCEEVFWPTSRPGTVDEPAASDVEWILDDRDYFTTNAGAPRPAADAQEQYEYYNTYWWHLGFIKRIQAPNSDVVTFRNEEGRRNGPLNPNLPPLP